MTFFFSYDAEDGEAEDSDAEDDVNGNEDDSEEDEDGWWCCKESVNNVKYNVFFSV